MTGMQEQLEIKFRLHDGSDIGPKNYPLATSVATLKESILAQWPKENENGPRTVNDIKLISAGKILESNKTLLEYTNPICDPSGSMTMHVIVRPPGFAKANDKKTQVLQKDPKCACTIM